MAKRKLTAALLLADMVASGGAAWAEDVLPDVEVRESRRANVSALWGPEAGTVTTVEAADIEERQATRIESLIDLLGGVPSSSNGGLSTAVQMRGFDISNQIQYNDHPDIQRMFVRDLATVERVEVLKGQLGVLYGQGAPGATINYVGKRPHRSGQRQESYSADSNGGYRTVVDLDSAPDTSPFSWRLVGAAQTGETWMKSVPRDGRTAFGVFNWRFSADNELRVEVEHQQNKQPFSFGTVYANGRFMFDRSYVAPASESDRRYERLGVYWGRRLGEGWSIKALWSASQVRRNEVLAGFWDILNTQSLSSYYRRVDDHARQYDGQVILGREFSSGSWKHDFQVGVRQDSQAIDFSGPQNFGGFTINIDAPDFSGLNWSALPLSPKLLRERYDGQDVFVADRIQVGERLNLMAGLRHADLTIDTNNGATSQRAAKVSHDLGALGASYKLVPDASVYVTYGESFEPNQGVTRTGAPVAPRTGLQTEAGVHWGSTDYLHAAAFRIQQDNLSASDPSVPGTVMTIGRVGSTGLELAFRQHLTSEWRLQGQTVVQRVSNERKTSATFGQGIPSVPGRYGSFTAARQFERMEFWSSLTLVGRRWGDPQNTLQASGYGRIDLGGRYRLGPDTEVQVAVRNLGDVRYVDYLDATSNVFQGDRRNLTLSLVQRL